MNGTDTVERLLNRSGCLLLDGSMGQELQRRGVPDDPRFWTAPALAANASQVRALHDEYVAAGADVLTTHTYATNWHRFEAAGQSDQFDVLNTLACELARQAADSVPRPVLVAGSLPPLRDSYRADQVVGYEQMLDEYSRQAGVLAAHVDLFLCETLTSAAEGRAAATAALAAADGRPVWVSWTLRDDRSGRLRSGESLADAGEALRGLGVDGALVNCSTPEALAVAVVDLVKLGTRVHGVYANGFHPIESPAGEMAAADFQARNDLDPTAYCAWAERWIGAGANLVGGCCEVGPAHIARLRQLIDDGSAAVVRD